MVFLEYKKFMGVTQEGMEVQEESANNMWLKVLCYSNILMFKRIKTFFFQSALLLKHLDV